MMTSDQLKRPQNRGVMLTEACVSLVLVGMVLAALSLMLTRYARAADYLLNYRRAQLAAESCIERMRAGLVDAADGAFTDAADVSYEIRVAEADQAWKPLQRVEVTARVVGKHGRVARYRISTCVAAPPPSRGGEP